MGTFGEWLRGQRTARKLTREEFAKRIGCSAAMLRKIEDSERRPSAQIAELIASCLEVPVGEREEFVKVARGELNSDRLARFSRPVLRGVPAQRSALRSNLPVLPTPLIGRQRELGELGTVLSDPSSRILTLAGPGGIGKTHLAIEAASQCQNEFLDGVCFVPLAPLQTSRLIVPVIASAAGFAFQGTNSPDPRGQLLSFLAQKQLLLILDNLEHLLKDDVIVDFLSELIAQSSQIKVLITSRESLRLHAETVYDVHGLPIPENTDAAGTSVELFLQRARRAHAGFDPTTDDYPAIVKICRLVNGMPLGIELAAAWVRTLSCEEIALEIERGLDFLSVSARDLPVRHRSMRAVFDHSWQLLADDERSTLLRLSVFRGGFTRDAAQQVADASLQMLAALVTKSLIRRTGTGRYDQHELVRQYAAARLQENTREAGLARDLHCIYFTSLLQQTEPRLKSGEQKSAIADLSADVDNLRSAWTWAVDQGKLLEIQKATRCLQWFFDLRGWLPEIAVMLKQAAEELRTQAAHPRDASQHASTLCLLVTYQGLALVRSGQVAQGQNLLQTNLPVTRSQLDPQGLADNLAFLGLADYLTGDYDNAAIHLYEALELSRSIQYDWIVCFSQMILAVVTQMKGKFEQAEALFREGLALGRSVGSPRNIGSVLIMYSALLRVLKRFQEAASMLHECLEIGRAENDQWLVAISLQHLSALAKHRGEIDYPDAMEMMEESVALFRELGDRWGLALSLVQAGEILMSAGQYAEARQYYLEAIQKSAEARVMPVRLDALLGFASLLAAHGSYENAYRVALLVLRQMGISQETRDRAEDLRADIAKNLTPAAVENAQASVADTAFESAIKEILEHEAARR
jgi:predicted ATPase/transcriptional regulator with XRE-family HTH domain/Tfp pilus assembly protein PilF